MWSALLFKLDSQPMENWQKKARVEINISMNLYSNLKKPHASGQLWGLLVRSVCRISKQQGCSIFRAVQKQTWNW